MPVLLNSLLGSEQHLDTALAKEIMSALRVAMPGIIQSFEHDWNGLISSLHRIGGAAQIIHAREINELSKKLESLSVEPVNLAVINEGLIRLEGLLKELDQAIEIFSAT